MRRGQLLSFQFYGGAGIKGGLSVLVYISCDYFHSAFLLWALLFPSVSKWSEILSGSCASKLIKFLRPNDERWGWIRLECIGHELYL